MASTNTGRICADPGCFVVPRATTSYTVDDTAQPIERSYLADLDAILNGHDISNRRTVFEQMILSLVRRLCTFNISEETVRLLGEVVDKEASLLEPLDGVADQYCVKKMGTTTKELTREPEKAP